MVSQTFGSNHPFVKITRPHCMPWHSIWILPYKYVLLISKISTLQNYSQMLSCKCSCLYIYDIFIVFDKCTFCNISLEDIEHLFFYCPFPISFWVYFNIHIHITNIKIKINKALNLEHHDILLRFQNHISQIFLKLHY